jgi:hypothetical protein
MDRHTQTWYILVEFVLRVLVWEQESRQLDHLQDSRAVDYELKESVSMRKWCGNLEAYALMCSIAGKANDIVLPLPVWAIATTSLPESAIGHA